METMKFKTNINCSGCVQKVTPVLDPLVGENNWKVETENPKKILTVTSDVPESTLMEQVKSAGFNIEKYTE
ncbi:MULTISPECIES: cation transporter [Flavobacterium]|uniref:heavy-metal-associated domain-containing protein n=1 Tax=Flavobacterium TaxID=237 RepID=UPI00095D9C4B|nr:MULTISPECIES: cation transporter [Flavobacterium]MBN9283893.1 cation transporter [Flavobacterium sp.]OJV68610.1 MAG: hypothetical protein BGO42_01900 [Flavobacterium sp. 40-81]